MKLFMTVFLLSFCIFAQTAEIELKTAEAVEKIKKSPQDALRYAEVLRGYETLRDNYAVPEKHRRIAFHLISLELLIISGEYKEAQYWVNYIGSAFELTRAESVQLTTLHAKLLRAQDKRKEAVRLCLDAIHDENTDMYFPLYDFLFDVYTERLISKERIISVFDTVILNYPSEESDDIIQFPGSQSTGYDLEDVYNALKLSQKLRNSVFDKLRFRANLAIAMIYSWELQKYEIASKEYIVSEAALANTEYDALFSYMYGIFLLFYEKNIEKACQKLEYAAQSPEYKERALLILGKISHYIRDNSYNTSEKPEDILLFQALGFSQSRFKDAQKYYEALTKDESPTVFESEALYQRGVLAETVENNLDKAAELYTACKDQKHRVSECNAGLNRISSAQYKYLQAVSEYRNRNFEAAVRLFSAAEAQNSYYAELSAAFIARILENDMFQFQKAVESYKHIIETFKNSSFSDYYMYRIAEIYNQKLKNYSEAVKWYQRLLDEYPASIWYFDAAFRMCDIYTEWMGLEKKAAEILEGMKNHHWDAKEGIYIRLGAIYENLEQVDRALENYNELISNSSPGSKFFSEAVARINILKSSAQGYEFEKQYQQETDPVKKLELSEKMARIYESDAQTADKAAGYRAAAVKLAIENQTDPRPYIDAFKEAVNKITDRQRRIEISGALCADIEGIASGYARDSEDLSQVLSAFYDVCLLYTEKLPPADGKKALEDMKKRAEELPGLAEQIDLLFCTLYAAQDRKKGEELLTVLKKSESPNIRSRALLAEIRMDIVSKKFDEIKKLSQDSEEVMTFFPEEFKKACAEADAFSFESDMDEKDTASFLELADLFSKAELYSKALNCYERYMEKSPGSSEVILRAAELSELTDRKEQAASLYLKTVDDKDSDTAQQLIKAADIYLDLKKKDLAEPLLKRAYASFNNRDALSRLIEMKINDRDMDAAQEMIDEIAENKQEQDIYYKYQAIIYEKRNMLKEAAESYEKYLALVPGDYDAILRVAEIFDTGLDDLPRAIPYYQQLIAGESKIAGRERIKKKIEKIHFKVSLDDKIKYVDENPYSELSSGYMYEIGETYEQSLMEYDNAIYYYTMCTDIYPKSPWAEKSRKRLEKIPFYKNIEKCHAYMNECPPEEIPHVLFKISRIYQELGEFSESYETLDKIAAEFPEWSDAALSEKKRCENLENIQNILSEKNPDYWQAANIYENELSDRNKAGRYLWLYLKNADVNQAKDVMNDVIDNYPIEDEYKLEIIDRYLKKGKNSDMKEYFEFRKARIYERQKKYDDAFSLYYKIAKNYRYRDFSDTARARLEVLLPFVQNAPEYSSYITQMVPRDVKEQYEFYKKAVEHCILTKKFKEAFEFIRKMNEIFPDDREKTEELSRRVMGNISVEKKIREYSDSPDEKKGMEIARIYIHDMNEPQTGLDFVEAHLKESPQVFTLMAEAYTKLENYSKLLKIYEKILQGLNLRTEQMDMLVQMGDTAYKLKWYSDAVRYYSEVKFIAGLQDTGEIDKKIEKIRGEQRSDWKKTVKIVKKEKKKDYMVIDRFREFREKIDELEQFVEKNPGKPAASEKLFELGDLYIKVEEYDKSIAAYERIIDEYPADKRPVYTELKLGDVYRELGEYDRAKDYYMMFIETRPADKKYYFVVYMLAELLEQDIQDYSTALYYYKKVYDEDDNGEYGDAAKFRMGWLNEKYLSRYTEAIQEYGELLDRYFDSKYRDDAQFRIGWIYQYELNQYSNANDAYRKIIENYAASEFRSQAVEEVERMKADGDI